uniref:BCL2 like 12 n=1 Tax=Sus scrofa TaxID=9823 RepID=A0A4X1VXP8_PIG
GNCIGGGLLSNSGPRTQSFSPRLPSLYIWLSSLSCGLQGNALSERTKGLLAEGLESHSAVPFPRSPAQEEQTDFLSRLRRCLPCSLGRGAVPPESPRPCSLPLRPCYGSEPGPATPDFYALVAQRLEQLVQEQLRSPPSPELQGHPPTEKEALLRKLVALLEEEAEVINQKEGILAVSPVDLNLPLD